MKLKKTKLSKAIYHLFFPQKKTRRRSTPKSETNSHRTTRTTTTENVPSENFNPAKVKYDLKKLRKQVSETEYLSNLRIGRSWVFPQLVRIGFEKNRNEYNFRINKIVDYVNENYRYSELGNVWTLIKRNYRAVSESNGTDFRSRWWTKEVLLDIMNWDSNITTDDNAEERKSIIENVKLISDYDRLSVAIDWYDQNRCKSINYKIDDRDIPDSFIDAFLGDGAYSAMMTMVKIWGLRIQNDTVCLSRDESIALIEEKANQMSGRELLEYCKKTFFDSDVFEYKQYIKKRRK